MQKVNALPTFVSQDADIKRNDSSSSQGAKDNDKEFSNLVEQHIQQKTSVDKNSKNSRDTNNTNDKAAKKEAANPDSVADGKVADDGKSLANDKQQSETVSSEQKNNSDKREVGASDDAERREGKQENTQAEKQEDDFASTQTSTQEAQKPDSEIQTDITNDSEAMLASQQFISLLYNSDQALANNKTNSDNTDNTDNIDLSNDDGTEVKKEQQTAIKNEASPSDKTSESVKVNNTNSAEHKLKVFVEELGKTNISSAISMDKVSDAELLTNKEVLNRYQQQLQLNDKHVLNKNTSNEVSPKAPQNNQDLVTEQVEAEAAFSDVASNEELGEEHDLKKVIVDSNDKGKSAALAKLKAQLENDSIASAKNALREKAAEAMTSEQSSQSNIDAEMAQVNQSELKQTHNQATAQQSTQGKKNNTSLESKAVEIAKGSKLTQLASDINVENEQKTAQREALEQPKPAIQSTASQVTTKTPQQDIVNRANSPESEGNSKKSNEFIDAEAELSLAETELSLVNKEDAVLTKPKSNQNQSDLLSRAFTDINSQATQVKQASDAYNNYQDNEVLNHNVATDTAQIQKNNVQLHQETISIFRKDFSDAVKDKVLLMVNQKLQQFDISLDPPEFGNMQVRVNLQGEQAAVNFVVQNQQAKDALDQNMHKLKDMLAEQGVDVGGANVEQQNQQNSQGEAQSDQHGSTISSLHDNAEKDGQLQILSANLFNSSATGVDYYA